MRMRVIVVLVIALAIWGWFDVRLRGTVDPNDLGLHKTDFTVYTEAGAAFFDGRDPYKVTNPRGWGYLYPPAFAMLIAPLHALPPRAGLGLVRDQCGDGLGMLPRMRGIGRAVFAGSPTADRSARSQVGSAMPESSRP